jgi:sugar phosphate permease
LIFVNKAIYLGDEYGLSEGDTALYFLIRPVIYSISVFTVGQMKDLNVKFSYGIGLFLTGISCFLYGIELINYYNPSIKDQIQLLLDYHIASGYVPLEMH